ncbi:cupredoxin domain-containing protein [Pseudomonas fulva]|uniref:Blue (Type 1) copper domain protein n=1 Tax=Pseudomonas fulva (strain 12-X) TaxID=743720 RepID=F6ABL0_PSEF1|nr:cupredoxin family protein [Pseudomonas fulva]AEF22202.1 blue (type 1) copper domain protein [Pseudomonas fulva 12-X]
MQMTTLLSALALTITIALSANAAEHDHAAGHAHGAEHGSTSAEQKPWGTPGDPAKATRTVHIHMNDQMRFVPDRLDVKEGETVRLVLHNDGQLLHEFVLGDKAQLDEHAAMMLRQPNMAHTGMDMLHVQPGEEGEVTWTFDRAGTFDFACLIAGHYQAGMVGKVAVMQ